MIHYVRRLNLLMASLAIVAGGMLLQACSERPRGPSAPVYAADVGGRAKTCVVAKVAPADGKETATTLQVSNEGGWCGITLARDGKPFAAGLMVTPPAHGKVLVHSVGDDTRVDYTPARGLDGPDVFAVKLIPGDAVLRVAVTITRP